MKTEIIMAIVILILIASSTISTMLYYQEKVKYELSVLNSKAICSLSNSIIELSNGQASMLEGYTNDTYPRLNKLSCEELQ